MAFTGETTTTLANHVATLYFKNFLDAAEPNMVHKEGAVKRTIQKNEGKTFRFPRFSPKAVTTTPLNEGENPAATSWTPDYVSATLAEYGDRGDISRFVTLTSVDVDNQEKIARQGSQMGKTMDVLTRAELDAGATVQLAGGKAAVSDVAASNTLSVQEIRKALATLEGNNAKAYDDGNFLLKVQPKTKYDLQGDSAWVGAAQYKDGDKRQYTGEIGQIFGTRALVTTNGKTYAAAGASNADLYANFIHGKEAFGVYDLAGDMPKLYIVPHTQVDSNNPTGAYSIVAWRGAFVAKTLQPNFLINIKTGASI